MNPIIIIKPEIENKFNSCMENGRILLFSAPCGFGKTAAARELLSGRNFAEVSAEVCDFDKISAENWDILLIDNLQLLQETELQQQLCALIRDNPAKRFVLLSRGLPPGWLMPFGFSGLMVTVCTDEMFFDRNCTAKLLEAYGVRFSETELTEIFRETMGYPLALSVIARKMSGGRPYDAVLSDEVIREIYIYYEEMIFRRFELPMRRFLLELAPFESFGTELAKMVSGDAFAGDMLSNIQKNSNMLIPEGIDTFSFWPIFRQFLLWEQKREFTEEQQRTVFSRGGLYYELHENYGKALEYYAKSGEQGKVSELLIKNVTLHPGMGHYEEMESYFLSLSDMQIASSPALMQGMSMLCALRMDYEASEKWYRELEDFAAVRKSSDTAAKEAKSRLVYLDISLPQRKARGLIKTIISAFKLMTAKEIKLPPFSVTSTLPSIMNGGKDFSDWSRKDDFLYATIKTPVEMILGKDGTGLPDCAVSESKFEKGEDVSGRMLSLVSKLSEVQTRGTPDIEFAIVGLLARSQIDSGRADDAKRTVLTIRERFDSMGLKRFLPNIDAFLCRIALRLGDDFCSDSWYKNKAPRNSVKVNTMKRYQYITQAMVELAMGDCDAVLLTLAPLEPYCRACGRNIDLIHIKVLTAAAKYRIDGADWKNDFNEALDIASHYGFVRTVGEYGAAVLPMIEESGWDNDGDFKENVLKNARGQAVFYPDYLEPANVLTEKLTDAEMQVLRLLCADSSNAEIGKILGIKLATVKSHVSHILQKLGVSRRNEAKTAAQKLKII